VERLPFFPRGKFCDKLGRLVFDLGLQDAVWIAEYASLLGFSCYPYSHPGSRTSQPLAKSIGCCDQKVAKPDNRLALFAKLLWGSFGLCAGAESSVFLVLARENDDRDTQILADCVKLGIRSDCVSMVRFNILLSVLVQRLTKFFGKCGLLVGRHPLPGSCESNSERLLLGLLHWLFLP